MKKPVTNLTKTKIQLGGKDYIFTSLPHSRKANRLYLSLIDIAGLEEFEDEKDLSLEQIKFAYGKIEAYIELVYLSLGYHYKEEQVDDLINRGLIKFNDENYRTILQAMAQR